MKLDIKEILEFIMANSDRDNPVKSIEMERKFHCTGGSIRDAIEELRRSGQPIASDQRGYFYAKSSAELEPTIEQLNKRAMSLHYTIKTLKQIYDPDYQYSMFEN